MDVVPPTGLCADVWIRHTFRENGRMKRLTILICTLMNASAWAQEIPVPTWEELFQAADPGPMIGLRFEQLDPALCPSGWQLEGEGGGSAIYSCRGYQDTALVGLVGITFTWGDVVKAVDKLPQMDLR